MPPFEEKTLLVANPAAQNGNGAQAAAHAAALLREVVGEDRLDVVLTEGPGHAEQVSAQAQGYGTVVALGGDGIIHETANGLLRLPECARPTLGVVPVGSGNDYARTLGISARSVDEAVRQLAGAHPRPFDVGRCNGRHFVETLAFGLDAAIALDTVERRRVTGKTGIEMEALTAASVACLTVYDMCKAVDRGMEIADVRLLKKDGGKTGLWER